MNNEEILRGIAELSDEHEFYTPIPKGYKIGSTKYVVIFGTVLSGLGKGIFSSSLAKLMQDKGLNVSPIKLEGYLNLDSGTLNPFRHGEVFVLDDGMECDMDLGNYERMIDKNLTKENFTTSGQIYKNVLELERKGKYLGRDVQVIPHITGEIKRRLRELALKSKADFVFVEIGGTVGDLENALFIEAVRELSYEEGRENVCFVALTYIIEPSILGEQKSKAAQLGIKRLMEHGIQPHIVACRAEHPVDSKIMEKISLYTNVPLNRVISLHNLESIYMVPQLLHESKIDEEVIKILSLQSKVDDKLYLKKTKEWSEFVDKLKNPKKHITVGITGKYTHVRDSYASIISALEHAGAHNGVKVDIKWIETTKIEEGALKIEDALKDVKGIIVPGGFGKRGIEGKIKCVEYARKNNIPFLGLCLGFQMAVIEFARNLCLMEDANTTEVAPETKHPVIDLLPEQLKIEGLGGNMRLGGFDVEIKKGTIAHKMFGSETARLRFRHRYECNPEYVDVLEKRGLVFSGKAPNQPIMQILELPKHKFFMATQAHPEFTSKPLKPSPFFYGFVKACSE